MDRKALRKAGLWGLHCSSSAGGLTMPAIAVPAVLDVVSREAAALRRRSASDMALR